MKGPQALRLGGENNSKHVRRINRLPIVVAVLLSVTFFAVIIYGLSSRGLKFGSSDIDPPNSRPAITDAEQLKRGIPDAIIGEPAIPVFQPAPDLRPETASPKSEEPMPAVTVPVAREAEESWQTRLEREQEEQLLREMHRQRMASMQADMAAHDAPIAVNLGKLSSEERAPNGVGAVDSPRAMLPPSALMASGSADIDDQNGQAGKHRFFNSDIADNGYLAHKLQAPRSRFELKRGSVIPATLISGINSDLPGLITAQVSQNVYDSAAGRYLLIPQGAKLLGRYDSSVSYGQSRVLAVWSDVIMPDGSTLQIAGMAGTDVAGYGGFKDKVDNHLLRTFGAAILVGLTGAGTDLILPRDQNNRNASTNVENAARRSFAESLGRVAEQTVTRGLNVQPTLQIRPGYKFNVLVDKDISLHGPYQAP